MDKFTQSMDAKLWADEFCKLNPAADNETMIGWFANAIMRGYDSGMVKGREQGMREAAGMCDQRWKAWYDKHGGGTAFDAAYVTGLQGAAKAILAAIEGKK